MIVPLSDWILVKQDPSSSKSPGGIELPDAAAKRATCSGLVRSCGPGKTNFTGELDPMGVDPGQRVLYPSGAAMSDPAVKAVEGEDHVLVREIHLIAALSGEEPTP